MTHIVKYSRYPNNEIRAIHYYKASPEVVNENSDTRGEPLPCPGTASSPEGECVADPPNSLDISSDFFHPSVSNRHKRTVFGTRAKNTILRIGGALDTVDSTPQNYIFLTGTIPGGTHDAFMAVANESPYICEAISKWLKRTAPSEHWFYVWELQKRGALHIHYCIYAPNPAMRDKILLHWKDKWCGIIQEVGRKSATDMWLRKNGTHHTDGQSVLQAYAQTVHKSVAAYMAGYCSSAKNKHQNDANSPYYPARWWGCARKTTNLLKALTETLTVEHNDYRSARYEMQVHYERVLHDSPKAHHYPHKVGIGSTTVSYHPEDKGQTIWQVLSPMLYKPTLHPRTSSLIQMYQRLVQETMPLLEASPKQLKHYCEPLLMTLRGCCFPSAARGYGIAQKDITVIRMIDCTLNSPLCTLSDWEKLRRNWCYLQDSVKEKTTLLMWDRFGNLSNYDDAFGLLDEHWSLSYSSTTEPKGEDAVRGAAHGSLSPQNPPTSQLELWYSSD